MHQNDPQPPPKEAWTFVDDGPAVPLAEVSPGTLFRCGADTLALLSEYGGPGQEDAYILHSGERFWGGQSRKEDTAQVIVQPLKLHRVLGVDWAAPTGDVQVEAVVPAAAPRPRADAWRNDALAALVAQDDSFVRVDFRTPEVHTVGTGRCDCEINGEECAEGFSAPSNCPRSASPDSPRHDRYIDVDPGFHAFGVAPAVLWRAEDAVFELTRERIGAARAVVLAVIVGRQLRQHASDPQAYILDHYFLQVQQPRGGQQPFVVTVIPVPMGVRVRAVQQRAGATHPYDYDRVINDIGQ